MQIRPAQSTLFSQVQAGIALNLARLARAQEQVATGKRIQRPSDDPTGAAKVLSYTRKLGAGERFSEATFSGRARLDLAAGNLEQAADVLAESRSLLVQGLNGTLTEDDRKVLAAQLRDLRGRLLEIGNAQDVDGHLFAGTRTDAPPFVANSVHGHERVAYAGTHETPELLVGENLQVATSLAGDQVFASVERAGTLYGGFTGVAAGQSGDVGTGFAHLQLRHDATTAALGSGLALAAGGALDTILGAHTLTVDAVAGTVQLDNGKALPIPQAGDPDLSDFTVLNEHGAELHLDFTSFTGASFTGAVDGQGSISLDTSTWVQLDFVNQDLELSDAATGTRLFVDTRSIHRAGTELVVFSGAVNAFDTLQGIADDLENVDGLPPDAVVGRLSLWLDELDRNQDQVIGSLGVLGGRSQHLASIDERIQDQSLDLASRRSTIEDTDYSQAVLELTSAEQALQLAQATGARLLSTSLLDFLR